MSEEIIDFKLGELFCGPGGIACRSKETAKPTKHPQEKPDFENYNQNTYISLLECSKKIRPSLFRKIKN